MAGIIFKQRRALAGSLAACMVAVGVPAIMGEGSRPTSLDLLGGAAWLMSEAQGHMVRVNGATGQVDAKVSVGESVGAAVAQDGDMVLVSVDGQVRSLDLTKLDWDGAIDADGALVVGDGVAYLVHPDGEVRELDPSTLRARATIDFDAKPGRGVIADGRLALPLDDGTLRIVDGDEEVGAVKVGRGNERVQVTKVGRRLVALNQSQGEVFEIDARRGRIRSTADVELPTGELLVPAKLPGGPLWLVALQTGELVRITPGTGAVAKNGVVTPRGDVAGPSAADGRVYLVDRGNREIVEVDDSTLEVQQRKPLDIDDASRVEMVAEGGYIFVNDLAGSNVVVIDGGDYRSVDKYDDEGIPGATPESPPAAGEAPLPNRPADDGQPAAPATGQPAAPATDPPAAPVRVTAVAGNESATVSWAHGRGRTPPSTYHVTYDGAGSPVSVAGGVASVEIDGLQNGDAYSFEVWASNPYGESDRVASNEVEPNDEVPGRPSGVAATEGDAAADVTWDAADGRGNDITGYIVTAAPGGQTATVDGGTTAATVEGLTNDTAYTFTVTAVNELDIQGEPSNASQPVTPYGPPTPLAGLVHNSGDGAVTLTWNASTSRTAVTYVVAVTPAVGGQTEFETGSTSWSRTGFVNGTTYNITVTPTNDHGAGTSAAARPTPGRAATVSNAAASRSADRTFAVTFDYDTGGLPVSACTVTRNGGTAVNATCNGGTGTASVTVPNYFTGYTFTARVENSRGSNTDAAAGTSAAKPYTIRSDGSAFDGTCTWDSGAGGRPNTRPYFTNPRHTCPMWDPPGDRPIGYLALGSNVRGECHIQGDEIRDDNLVSTTTWIRISGRGYMPTIYFTNYQSSPTANLPAC